MWRHNPCKKVHHFLDPAGELLPLLYDGEKFWLFNCTECINAVNRDASEWYINPDTNKRAWVTKWAFHPERFTQSVFSVPELSCSGILVSEECGDPKFEFKAFVESEGLTGLVFKELWDSEAG